MPCIQIKRLEVEKNKKIKIKRKEVFKKKDNLKNKKYFYLSGRKLNCNCNCLIIKTNTIKQLIQFIKQSISRIQ